MARRALLCSELGAGLGHAVTLRRLADGLSARGWSCILALPSRLPAPAGLLDGCAVARAPAWPRPPQTRGGPRSNSTGDRIAARGLAEPALLADLLSRWHLLFARTMPDLVVADFAPASLLAARDRIATIGIGTGFTVPPRGLPRFARDRPADPLAFDEAAALDSVNAVLGRSGASTITTLPEILNGDRDCVCSLPLLDHYRADRAEPLCGPLGTLPPAAEGGDDVLCYFQPGRDRRRLAKVAAALRMAALPTTVLLPDAAPEEAALFDAPHIRFHAAYVPMAPLVAAARLVLHAGSHGTAVTSLFAAVPQVILPYDVEKRPTAAAIAAAGAGRSLILGLHGADEIAAAIRDVYEDAATRSAAYHLAEEHAGWRRSDRLGAVVEAAEALAA